MKICQMLLVGFESKTPKWLLEKRIGFISASAIFPILPFTLLAVVANTPDTEVEVDFTGNREQSPFVGSCP